MTRYNNDMADFKPVYQLIRKKLKAYAAYAVACRQNAKLQPGPSMEERIAARSARYAEIFKAYQHAELGYQYTVSGLLTAHRTMRSKPANHGIKPENAATVTQNIIELLRKELKTEAEHTPAVPAQA